MNFFVKKDDLLSAIARAINASDASLDIEAYKSIKVFIRGDYLELSSTSPGIFSSACVPIEREGGSDVELFLPAKRFMDIVKVLDGDIKARILDTEVKLSSGRSCFSVKKLRHFDLPEKVYPAISAQDFKPLDVSSFYSAVKKVSNGIAKDDDLATIIKIDTEHIVSTNRQCLALAENKFSSCPGEHIFTSSLLSKALDSAKRGNKNVFHLFHENELHLTSSDTTVILSVVAAKFPNYMVFRQPYKDKGDCSSVIRKDDLVHAIEKVLVTADGEHNRITIESDTSKLVWILKSTSEDGDASAEVPCISVSTAASMKFNASLLMKGLKQFTGDEVYVKILANDKPVLFYEEGYEFYASPLRF